jgi:hypothetical protein
MQECHFRQNFPHIYPNDTVPGEKVGEEFPICHAPLATREGNDTCLNGKIVWRNHVAYWKQGPKFPSCYPDCPRSVGLPPSPEQPVLKVTIRETTTIIEL